MYFQTRQFGGCYITYNRVASCLVSPVLSRLWGALEFWRSIDSIDHVTSTGHCDHFVQAGFVKSSATPGLEFSNL